MLLIVMNEIVAVLQPCGTPGSGAAGQLARSPTYETRARYLVFFLIRFRIVKRPARFVFASATFLIPPGGCGTT